MSEQDFDFFQDHSRNFLEMALKTDKQEYMDCPDGYGKRTGVCGDTVEIFLKINHKTVASVSFHVNGCINTNACCNTVAHMAEGRSVEAAWGITPEKIIDFLEMEFIRDGLVGELGYGLRKRVDLGRALALEPAILIMDEPMAGMNVEEKEDMARFIIDIQEYRKIPIILVEHDMEVVMDISNRIAVLEWGHMIAEGPPKEIRENPRVIKAYLGEE